MNYPPRGCAYVVQYYDASGRLATSRQFLDEYELGDWFKGKEARGEIVREYEGKDGGFRIYCVSNGEYTPIDHLHPRLVMGRLEKPVPRA